MRAYVEVLKSELELLRSKLAPGVTLSRLHWGGGTPTLIPANLMRELATAIFSVIPLGPNAEFSVEIDPNEIDDLRLDALAEAGMTRASIGVQDFDADIQKTIGRIQSYATTKSAVDKIRTRGITSLNADILYGLPGQTRAGIATSVQQLLSLSPDRVALYGYAHVPWMARRQLMIPSDTLPRPEDRLKLFETARDLFVWDGYSEIGIDHFARPEDGLAVAQRQGQLKRNFQGYTDDRSPVLIGLGASSISYFPQGYAQNASGTAQHIGAVRAGHFSTARGHEFQGEDRLRARMIEELMCDFHIDANALSREFDVSQGKIQTLFATARATFGDCVEVTEKGLTIPDHAKPLTRMIARSFDAYELAKTGHSSAV